MRSDAVGTSQTQQILNKISIKCNIKLIVFKRLNNIISCNINIVWFVW